LVHRRTAIPLVPLAPVIPLVVAALAAPATADTVYQTGGPFGGFFGLWGADVSATQSVGVRFVPAATRELERIGIWFMSNAPSTYPTVTLELRADSTQDGTSVPAATVLEAWHFSLVTLGWNPVQHWRDSKARPVLDAGTRYWVVARSSVPSGQNAVWNFAAAGNSFNSFTSSTNPESWQPGGSGAALCIVVHGAVPANPADLNGDGSVGPADLAALLAAWGTPGPGDLSGDGTVGPADLAALLAAWGS
jgi:hypothetical protein